MKVTKHGKKRLKERVGLPAKAHERHMEIVYYLGIGYDDLAGAAQKYVGRLYKKSKYYGTECNDIRIYGRHVYLLKGRVLVTVWDLPSEFHKAVDKAIDKARDV